MVDSDESRDRKDIKEHKRVRIAIPGEMESSRSCSSATAHGSVESSKTTAGQRKRCCISFAAETDTLSEYELERIKRVKANQEVLMSLCIETPLPKTRLRSRNKPQILFRAREEDNAQSGRDSMGLLLAASETEGDDQPRGEPAALLLVSTSASAVSEEQNATGGAVGEGTLPNRASCEGKPFRICRG